MKSIVRPCFKISLLSLLAVWTSGAEAQPSKDNHPSLSPPLKLSLVTEKPSLEETSQPLLRNLKNSELLPATQSIRKKRNISLDPNKELAAIRHLFDKNLQDLYSLLTRPNKNIEFLDEENDTEDSEENYPPPIGLFDKPPKIGIAESIAHGIKSKDTTMQGTHEPLSLFTSRAQNLRQRRRPLFPHFPYGTF